MDSNTNAAPEDGIISEVDLGSALLAVSSKIPQIKWVTMAAAMSACVKCMPREGEGSKNETVITFMKDCIFQVFHVMISLKNIEGNPTTYTGLQQLWKEESFAQFNQCFYDGLRDAMRILVRIGHVSTAQELKNWNTAHVKQWHKPYMNSLVVFLDCKQAVYQSMDHNQNTDKTPNSLWTHCLATFFEEGGFAMLLNLVDSGAFKDLTGHAVAEAEHLLQCQLALLIKNLVTREHVVFGDLHMPTAEEVGVGMAAVETITAGALHWLQERVNVTPDKLTWQDTDKDAELVVNLMGLFGSEQSLRLIRDVLSHSNLKQQQTGVFLIQGLDDDEMRAVYLEYLKQLQSSLSGSGDDLVLQLENLSVEKQQLVSILQSLLKLGTKINEDPLNLSTFWGDLALRCLCTSKQSSRNIGFGLVDSLKGFDALKEKLTKSANDALLWLTLVCGLSEDTVDIDIDIYKSLQDHDLVDWDQFGQLFICVHQMLRFTDGIEIADTLAEIFMSTAVRCLQYVDHYELREFGVLLIKNGLYIGQRREDVTSFTICQSTQFGNLLRTITPTKQYLKAVLDSLFCEEYVNSALIVHVSTWLVEVYYREYCYENDVIDLMPYLVEALIHSEWGVVEPVTELLVTITVTNISIKSLNSLCELFKQLVSNKETSELINPVICVWFAKTRHKKWVVMVQERFLNLLWTVLMNTKVESTDVCASVLEYFKNQFNNIKVHAHSDWGGVESDNSDRGLTAKQCIITCAADCFVEIERCGGAYKQLPSSSNLSSSSSSSSSPSVELRNRASQAATLLYAIFSLVDNLRPDLLREINHQGSPSEMIQGLLDEALQSASYDDVDPTSLQVRLLLIADMSSYLIESSPLTFSIVKRVWDSFFGIQSDSRNLSRHRQVCLTWFSIILDQSQYASIEASEARRFVLEQLAELVTGSEMDLQTVGTDSMNCLLSLFISVNTHAGVLKVTGELPTESDDKTHRHQLPSFVQGQELESNETFSLQANKTDISCFDLLVNLALDSTSYEAPIVIPACRTLLKVCSACHDAQRSAMDGGAALKRYDLLQIIFSRIDDLRSTVSARSDPTFTVSEITNIKHWLTVLCFYFEETSRHNNRVAHESCIQGEQLVLSVGLEIEVTEDDDPENKFVPYQVTILENMTMSELLSKSIQVLLENDVVCEGDYVLRYKSKYIKDLHRTLKSYGIVNGETLKLEPAVIEVTPSSIDNFPSPSEQFSDSEDYLRTIFGLLKDEELCDHAWGILQMVPSAASEQALIHDLSQANWTNVVGTSDASRGLWQRVYSCQLVEKMVFGDNGIDLTKLIQLVSGGCLKAILTMLEDEDLTIRCASLRLAILSPLKIVNSWIQSNIVKDASADNDAWSNLESAHVISGFMFGALALINNASGLTESEVGYVTRCIGYMTILMGRMNAKTWKEVSKKFPLDILGHLLLESPVKVLREEIQSMFVELLSIEKGYALYDDVNGMKSATEVLVNNFFGQYLCDILSDSKTPFEYFSVCLVLLDDEHIKCLELGTVRSLVQTKLESLTTSKQSDVSDSVLTGVLTLLSRLHNLDPPSPQESQGLVGILLNSFLGRMQK